MGPAKRTAIGFVLAIALAACASDGDRVATSAHAAAPAALDGWRELADGVYFRQGTFAPGRQPDGNSLLLHGATGWIAVDTGRHAAHAQAIVDAVRGSGRPLVAIVNTHWHLDHVSGNAPLRDAYPHAEVHASTRIEREMQGFLAAYRGQLEALLRDRPGDAQAADWRAELARIAAGPGLFPTRPVTAPGERRIDGRTLVLGLVGDAVSGGDVWILDPSTRTLAAGDLVTWPVPFLDTACPDGWARALSALAELPFERLVPGHGEPMTRDGFERYRRAHARLLACAAEGRADAECADGWVADADGSMPAEEAARAHQLLVDYYLPAKLRPGTSRPAYCGG